MFENRYGQSWLVSPVTRWLSEGVAECVKAREEYVLPGEVVNADSPTEPRFLDTLSRALVTSHFKSGHAILIKSRQVIASDHRFPLSERTDKNGCEKQDNGG